MSTLVDSHWPSLIYDGPSSINARSALWACFLYFSSSTFLPSFLTHSLLSLRRLRTIGRSLTAILTTCSPEGFLIAGGLSTLAWILTCAVFSICLPIDLPFLRCFSSLLCHTRYCIG